MIDTDADLDRIQHIAAEHRAWELVEALKAALAGDSHWRHRAQDLLALIANCDLPEPRR